MESDFKNETGFNSREDESTTTQRTTRTKITTTTHVLHKDFITQIGIS